MGIAEQIDHRFLVFLPFLTLTLQQQFPGPEQIGRDDLLGNLFSLAVHVEGGSSYGIDGVDLVILEVPQMEGSAHWTVCTYGSQSHMEAHLAFTGPLVGNAHDDVVIIEVQIRIVGHLFLVAIDECLRLGDVRDELLGVERV